MYTSNNNSTFYCQFTEEGVPIEPFNLKNEREGGYFDENENYVFKKEIGEVDAWVAGLDEQTIEAAIGEAAAAEKRRLAKRDLDEARIEQKKKSAADLKAEMLTYLVPGETISGCLRRLSGRSGGIFYCACMAIISTPTYLRFLVS
jgi:CD2 antigen cytoplasmic tail-binding protein 2